MSEDTLFSPLGEDLFGEQIAPTGGALNKRFVAPPFSVLDGRQGWWLERKRAWIDGLGIQSEIGREGNLLNFSAAMNAIGAGVDAYSLTPEERQAFAQAAGTSVFDPVLCELAYLWWAPRGARILDPFAGGSVRGIVAGWLGFDYVGVELREEQVAANRAQADRIRPTIPPLWICGDSSDLLELAGPERFGMLLTCPPYGDLERYSEDPRDLSTMSWEAFENALWGIIGASLELLEEDSFSVWVVGDFRGPDGIYRGFPISVVEAHRVHGASLYNEAALLVPIGSLPYRAGRIFNGSRKLAKAHQNVLVFVKGSWERAAAKVRRREEESDGSD